MIITRLRLRAYTAIGEVGVTIPFSKGLVLLRAEGAGGKSNCLLAILYALGLDGMLGPSKAVPLKHAMTDFVDVDGEEVPVISSEVMLEIQDAAGRFITVLRSVKGNRSRDLVTVWEGEHLEDTESASVPSRDFFVRVPGAVTNAAGFHQYLASFFGWKLPGVLTYGGETVPLYMESIFPLLFVEQVRGWSAIEGIYPTHFRIRDPGTRAVEFILALGIRDLAARRALLERDMESVRVSWTQSARQVDAVARNLGAVVHGLPNAPVAEWPTSAPPRLLVSAGENWEPIDALIATLESELAEKSREPARTTAEVAPQLEADLREAERRVRTVEAWLSGVFNDIELLELEITRTEERIRALADDLTRNKDALRLKKLGSTRALAITSDRCPTCHQSVELALLPEVRAAEASPMTLEDNVRYLEDQRDMFQLVLAQTQDSLSAKLRQSTAGGEELARARATVRDLRAALVAHPLTTSKESVAEIVRLEARIDALKRGVRLAQEYTNEFTVLAERWADLQARLAELPEDSISAEDAAKLGALQSSFTEQLVEYGLTSVEPHAIVIPRDSLRPEYKGFDLQFDLAGSDATRATWAYRNAFLEVARTHATNHPGFLIIDEPQQQHPSLESFGALLRRVSRSERHDQQVIISTNEKVSDLRALLEGHSYTLLDYGDERMMRLVSRTERPV
ncbi:hypothetical protein J421_4644 (plasmid) [Gemmatirosa kalamazoonensis]|uniref:Rad50/SbcC-type AAA domain-containing protein n=1 Tax=Gemmatirosa kalamazoonensis TaxID=861299 RepID=W0RMA0_9BACT|nr:hypothetical protein [Gemmatirosa kalamazoonensis]AHG92111.1 hypothetical protein J421_4576 [Gemmatirosa kalamazoonensis]AHG92179.1 hypothetical protein J421_4644 [Gemmatirosa kalamazoonensis]